MGKKIEKDGVLVIYKERGITSFQVLRRLKRIFKFKKIGHGGTLDPFAEGVMVVFVNRATKISQFFLNSKKVYDAKLFLGILTDTLDGDGDVVGYGFKSIPHEDFVEDILKRYIGKVIQRVPNFSAVKYMGKPLYYYSRRGMTTPDRYKLVEIFSIELKSYFPPFLSFEVECSGGTYVRSLGYNIAKDVCGAGHLVELKRKRVKSFTEDNSLRLGEIEKMDVAEFEERLIPVEESIKWLPKLILKEEYGVKFSNGVKMKIYEKDGLYRVFSGKKFMGVGEVKFQTLHPIMVFK